MRTNELFLDRCGVKASRRRAGSRRTEPRRFTSLTGSVGLSGSRLSAWGGSESVRVSVVGGLGVGECETVSSVFSWTAVWGFVLSAGAI